MTVSTKFTFTFLKSHFWYGQIVWVHFVPGPIGTRDDRRQMIERRILDLMNTQITQAVTKCS
jgi:hypothetical protein